jgi:hypothetical protein
MPVFRYDDEEWENLIEAHPGWSRAETDYLLDMCERFELRFLVIADRYEVGLVPRLGLELRRFRGQRYKHRVNLARSDFVVGFAVEGARVQGSLRIGKGQHRG